MTVAQAAKRIGISASNVYQLVAAKKIAHYRVGGKILFQEDDVAAFLAGCRVGATPAESTSVPPRLKLKHIRVKRGS